MTSTTRFKPRTTARLVAAMEQRLEAARHAAHGLRNDFADAMASQDVSDLVDEEGGARQDPDEMLQLTELAENHVEEIEEALDRIAKGAYGLCRQCEDPIPLKRLEALPETPWCLDCSRRATRV